MTRAKKPNSYAKRFANMDMAGGNHKAQTPQGIVQEGRKSYKQTVDQKLGTNHSKGMNSYAKKFAPIKQELGSNPQQKQTVKPKQQAQTKQATPQKKTNSYAQKFASAKHEQVAKPQQQKQAAKPKQQTQAKQAPKPKGRTR